MSRPPLVPVLWLRLPALLLVAITGASLAADPDTTPDTTAAQASPLAATPPIEETAPATPTTGPAPTAAPLSVPDAPAALPRPGDVPLPESMTRERSSTSGPNKLQDAPRMLLDGAVVRDPTVMTLRFREAIRLQGAAEAPRRPGHRRCPSCEQSASSVAGPAKLWQRS